MALLRLQQKKIKICITYGIFLLSFTRIFSHLGAHICRVWTHDVDSIEAPKILQRTHFYLVFDTILCNINRIGQIFNIAGMCVVQHLTTVTKNKQEYKT